jgi:hypothetical protein
MGEGGGQGGEDGRPERGGDRVKGGEPLGLGGGGGGFGRLAPRVVAGQAAELLRLLQSLQPALVRAQPAAQVSGGRFRPDQPFAHAGVGEVVEPDGGDRVRGQTWFLPETRFVLLPVHDQRQPAGRGGGEVDERPVLRRGLEAGEGRFGKEIGVAIHAADGGDHGVELPVRGGDGGQAVGHHRVRLLQAPACGQRSQVAGVEVAVTQAGQALQVAAVLLQPFGQQLGAARFQGDGGAGQVAQPRLGIGRGRRHLLHVA